MINMGLSAKQETDDRFQQIKKEVIDMIKVRAPSMELKVWFRQVHCTVQFVQSAIPLWLGG